MASPIHEACNKVRSTVAFYIDIYILEIYIDIIDTDIIDIDLDIHKHIVFTYR